MYTGHTFKVYTLHVSFPFFFSFLNVNNPPFFLEPVNKPKYPVFFFFFHILSLLSSRLNLHKLVSSLSHRHSLFLLNSIMKIVIDCFYFYFYFECSSITKAFRFSSESLIGSTLSLFPLYCSLSQR